MGQHNRQPDCKKKIGKGSIRTKHRTVNTARTSGSGGSHQMAEEGSSDGQISPPANQTSPNNPNLSYHQQQQLHHQHLHRTGGLQRLTADLAGLQFNDPEALLKDLAPAAQTGKHHHYARQIHQPRLPSVRRPRDPPEPPAVARKGPNATTRSAAAAVAAVAAASNGTAANQAIMSGYEEQMTLGSEEYDPARDAQETAEDAAILRRYKISNLIGIGNYARVYKCTSQSGKELAVKSINLSKTSENYKQKFLPRELTILRKVNHVNICKVHEIIQVADRVFIVMQFCSRGTIADLLHKLGPLGEPLARNLFTKIFSAVIYLHSIDVAHRDLKVENILLDENLEPKLTDFSYSTPVGVSAASLSAKKHQYQTTSKRISPNSRLNETFCGTLPYLSPEMIRQQPYDSKKNDIWSLGVCLYVMLNDRLPFPYSDIKLMLQKQLIKDYKFKNTIEASMSDLAKDLVSQMLEPDCSKRISSSDISKHPWMTSS